MKYIMAIIIMVLAIYIFSMCIAYMMTKPRRLRIKSNPKKSLGIDYEDVEFISQGNKIKGWYIPAEIANERFTIVYAHGYSENRETFTIDIYRIIEEFRPMGANILTFDFSASGESEGSCVTCGYREKYDLLKAIEYAKTKSSLPIIAYGISMGAATTAMITSECKDIVAAICDSPYSDLKSYLSNNLSAWTHLPKHPFQHIILKTMEATAGIGLDRVVPIDSVKHTLVPILIIHGKGDHLIPYTESVKINEANPVMTELHIIDNIDHCKSLEKERDLYMKYVGDFIEKVIE